MDKTLRRIGFGDKIDDFVLSMNQAAEQATPAAREIFLEALFDLTIKDANEILNGSDTATTNYFKSKTYEKLAQAFRPTVNKALAKYDVTDKYDQLIEQYKTIPFAGKIKMLSPDDYVINKTLDGLFLVLGKEEKNIRENPSARANALLKKVFN